MTNHQNTPGGIRTSREVPRYRRRRGTSPLTLIIRFVVLIVALVISWYAFTYIRDNYIEKDTGEETPSSQSNPSNGYPDKSRTKSRAR